jgi:hypothetical protein
MGMMLKVFPHKKSLGNAAATQLDTLRQKTPYGSRFVPMFDSILLAHWGLLPRGPTFSGNVRHRSLQKICQPRRRTPSHNSWDVG